MAKISKKKTVPSQGEGMVEVVKNVNEYCHQIRRFRTLSPEAVNISEKLLKRDHGSPKSSLESGQNIFEKTP